MRPGSLSELRLWLVAGDRLAGALSQICKVERLQPADWQAKSQADRPPTFLLVEASKGAGDDWGQELDSLLNRCIHDSVSRLLWIADDQLDPYWLTHCHRFNRIFCMDRKQLAQLEAAGVRRPSVLWPAALPLGQSHSPAANAEESPVVWLGGWSQDWPLAWRERLASVLQGASRYGLRIFPVADLDGLPSDLHRCVSDSTGAPTAEAALRSAQVVIAADPTVGSSTFAPSVAFDVPLLGAAPITAHDFATIHDFSTGGIRKPARRDLMPVVHDSDGAADEVERLLGDDAHREETVEHLCRIIDHNHTYRHRLATLASALGHRVIPDALDSAPA